MLTTEVRQSGGLLLRKKAMNRRELVLQQVKNGNAAAGGDISTC